MEAPEISAMPSSPSYAVAVAAPKKNKYRKQVIYGAFILLVLVLVYVVMKQKAQIDDGFSAYDLPDGRTIPTPCKATDRARVLRASYKSGGKTTDVADKLQDAYSAQAGNLPYTVNSAALLGGAAAPGSLTFHAECPEGRAH